MNSPSHKNFWSNVMLDPRLVLAACGLTSVLGSLAVHSLGVPASAATMAGVAMFIAICWVTEVIPIPVTSLLPLILLPALGIANIDVVASNYGKPVIFLFLGGFLLAFGIQCSRLHRRIALNIVNALGSRPSRLILGFNGNPTLTQ